MSGVAIEGGGPASGPSLGGLLSLGERRTLGVQLTLSMFTAGLLMMAAGLQVLLPGRGELVALVAGLAALLVTVPALAAAWHSLRHPDLHGLTDQLVALAVLACWAEGDLFTAALLPLVMTVGHVLEERSLIGGQEALRALRRLTQTSARRVLADGSVEEVGTAALRVGDVVQLRAGDRMPADGVVRDGQSSMDNAPITGESVPEEVAPGSAVFEGSINLSGLLLVEVERIGDSTTLGRVIGLMQQAERAKPPVTRLLERYAGAYMVLVLLIAAGVWFATGLVSTSLAVLVAACPCAVVLAAPATSVAALAVAARHGILVKSAAFLEQLATVNSVVLDKTGTVTLGELRLVGMAAEPGVTQEALVARAAALGSASTHPVSRALAALMPEGEHLPLRELRELPGFGVAAEGAGGSLAMGRPELFDDLGIAAPPPPDHDGPIAGLAEDGRFIGWMLLADEPRPEAEAALEDLRQLGLRRMLLLTGDRTPVARRIASLLRIPEFRAEALPHEKLDRVLAETRAGFRPMVVGDGINDSLALKAGAVGVAMGGHGTDAALASADLVLMTSNLRRLATCVRLSRRCRTTIHVNVGLGLGWTAAIIGLAAAGVLGPSGALIAAVAHNVGTLAVMANAGRLLKFQEA